MRLIKVFLAVIISNMILYFLKLWFGWNEVFPAVLICGLISYLLLLRQPSAGASTSAKTTTVERIVNLQDDSLGAVFRPSDYPGYTLLSQEGNEKVYSTTENTVLVTRVITTQSASPPRASSSSRWVFFAIAAFVSYLVWSSGVRYS